MDPHQYILFGRETNYALKEKFCIRETPNLATCADNSKDKNIIKNIRCQVSHVTKSHSNSDKTFPCLLPHYAAGDLELDPSTMSGKDPKKNFFLRCGF